MTDAERVRMLVGEVVPENGADTDTMFLNEQILDLLAGRTVEAAVAEAWRMKAAQLADLVDTAEGTSKRSMSDLHAHALSMVEMYAGMSGTVGLSSGQTRISSLKRI